MIGVTRDGDVMTLEMQRADRRNALNGALVDGLREAVEKALAFDPHVVLLDLGLPDVDGYDVARELRRRERRRLYVVALTGMESVHDRDRSRAAGIDMHVVKPATIDKLAEVIELARHSGESDAPDSA